MRYRSRCTFPPTDCSCRSVRFRTSDQEEQRTQRGAFVAIDHTSSRIHAAPAAVCHRAGIGYLARKFHVNRLGTSLRIQTEVSHRSLGCSIPGMHSARLFVAPNTETEVVGVGYEILNTET